MEEVEGGWRGIHNEDLHNFHASQNIIIIIVVVVVVVVIIM